MNHRNLLLRRAVITALSLSVMPVTAQVTPPERESGRTLEVIVVTAQKREQSLQDVPIVVTVVSEQLLQDSGVRDIKDLTLLAPGLTVTSTSSEASTTARIRGIGTVGDNPGLESSVGVVIDGVYRPRNGVGFGDLGDLERIEVLKGPQGTLFGKNTSAGVINIVTKRPTEQFGAEVELTAGDYGALEGAASISGPLSEGVAGSLYVAARERDGFLDVNTGPGPRTEREDNDREVLTFRGQLALDPSDALDIRLIADYSERDESCCAAVQVVRPGAAAAIDFLAGGKGINTPGEAFDRVAYSNRSTKQDVQDMGLSAEVNIDFDAVTFTSVTASRNWESLNAQDVDFTIADIWHRDPTSNQSTEFGQASQEFRLAGETDMLNWLVGAFYASEELDSRQQIQFGTQYGNYMLALAGGAPTLAPLTSAQLFPPGQGSRDVHAQESKTWALFTNNSIRFTDALELTLGVRYTSESKDLDSRYRNTHMGQGCGTWRAVSAGLPAAVLPLMRIACVATADPSYSNLNNSQSLDEDEWSGTAKLAFRFTDEVMAYTSFARGYKAGGFNLDRVRTGAGDDPTIVPVLDTHFDKELVDSYEVGVKTQWAGNTLLLNASVFYQDYSDFQLNTFDGVQFLVTSLEQVTSEGADLDIVWFTPLEQLSLQGGVTYTDTLIEDSTALSDPRLFRQDRENDTMSFAPEWSASLSATFEQPIGTSLIWRTNIGAKYTSEYNTGSNLAPEKAQDAMTLVNARMGIGADDESWTVEAWAQNVTDEEYYQVVFDAPLQTGGYNAFLGAPRTYGVTARFKF